MIPTPTPPLPAAAPDRISVALVEDDAGMRGRFEQAIAAAPHLSLACALSSAREISAWLADHPVDVLLVDLGLPDGSGIDVIGHCLRLQPACEVMVITMFGDETNMMKAFSAGAKGYLLKDGTEEDLAAHITQLRSGGSPMSPIIARQLLGRLGPARAAAPPAEAPTAPPLSPKEAEVLSLVARGFSYGEVAGLLKISVHTVHTHARNIYGKLSVKSKTEAVFEARQLGLLGN
jgi:DNA-binding NarL/FixJ family response regulator